VQRQILLRSELKTFNWPEPGRLNLFEVGKKTMIRILLYKFMFNVIFICVIAFIGCSVPRVIIHKSIIKPKEIRDTIKAVRQLRLVENGELNQFEELYKGIEFRSSNYGKGKKDTSAVVSFYPDRREFDLSVFPDTITHYDTIHVNDGPIIVKGNSDWERAIWIIGTLIINVIVFFVGRKLKR
jgi:hypothetical protein